MLLATECCPLTGKKMFFFCPCCIALTVASNDMLEKNITLASKAPLAVLFMAIQPNILLGSYLPVLMLLLCQTLWYLGDLDQNYHYKGETFRYVHKLTMLLIQLAHCLSLYNATFRFSKPISAWSPHNIEQIQPGFYTVFDYAASISASVKWALLLSQCSYKTLFSARCALLEYKSTQVRSPNRQKWRACFPLKRGNVPLESAGPPREEHRLVIVCLRAAVGPLEKLGGWQSSNSDGSQCVCVRCLRPPAWRYR